MIQKYQMVSGAGSASNAGATTVLITGVANKVIRLTGGTLSITVAATGGSGKVSLKDGTTVIMSWDANSLTASIPFNFGENSGYPLTAGNTLNLVVESAVTNQATAIAAVVGFLAA